MPVLVRRPRPRSGNSRRSAAKCGRSRPRARRRGGSSRLARRSRALSGQALVWPWHLAGAPLESMLSARGGSASGTTACSSGGSMRQAEARAPAGGPHPIRQCAKAELASALLGLHRQHWPPKSLQSSYRRCCRRRRYVGSQAVGSVSMSLDVVQIPTHIRARREAIV